MGLTMKASIFPTLLAVILLAFLSSPGSAAVYLWRDSTGTAHYTNKEYEIPDRYRKNARVLYPETTDTAQNQQGSAPAGSQPQQTPAPQPDVQGQQQQRPVVTVPAENGQLPGRRQKGDRTRRTTAKEE